MQRLLTQILELENVMSLFNYKKSGFLSKSIYYDYCYTVNQSSEQVVMFSLSLTVFVPSLVIKKPHTPFTYILI